VKPLPEADLDVTTERSFSMRRQGPPRAARGGSALALLATTITVVAAGAAQAAQTATSSTRIPGHARITLRSSEYGKVISDTRGQVLYLFAADKGPTSTCSNACAKAWPPLLTKGAPTAGAGFWYVVKANGTANLAKGKTHM
jgi:predicted lipoprotein with Yx(FWY)xxD motif